MLVAGPIKSAVLIEKVSQLGLLLGQGAEVVGAQGCPWSGPPSPGARRMAGGQSPPLPAEPGHEEYPGWVDSFLPSISGGSPTCRCWDLKPPYHHALLPSLPAAFPGPETCFLSQNSSGTQRTGPCLLLRSPLPAGKALPTLLSSLIHPARLCAAG